MPSDPIHVPFVYEMPDDGADGPVWRAELLEHVPADLDSLFECRRQEMPFFAERRLMGRVAGGRLWLPVDRRSVRLAATDGRIETGSIQHLTSGIAVPVAGMTSAFSSVTMRIDVVEPGTDEGLPAREAALAGAKSVAARTASSRSMLLTSSFEPMVPLTRPAAGETGIVFRDVHGLWRHPSLRLRSSRRIETPLVPLVVAQALAKFPFGPAARKIGIPGLDLSGFDTELPEADMAVYDVLRDVCRYLPTGASYARSADPGMLEAAWEAEALLDLYEDPSAPLPPAAGTARILDDLSVVFGETGPGTDGPRNSYLAAMERFDAWRDLRGGLLDPAPDADGTMGFETDEAIASFRM